MSLLEKTFVSTSYKDFTLVNKNCDVILMKSYFTQWAHFLILNRLESCKVIKRSLQIIVKLGVCLGWKLFMSVLGHSWSSWFHYWPILDFLFDFRFFKYFVHFRSILVSYLDYLSPFSYNITSHALLQIYSQIILNFSSI